MRESAGLRLAVLFGSFFIALLISSIFSKLIEEITWIDPRTRILLVSIVQSLIAFCGPAILVAKFASSDWKGWLFLSRAPRMKAFAGVVVVYIISLPAMEWLVEFNANLHLPDSMQGIETTLRAWEDNAATTTEILLNATGFWSVLSGILVIGILTGFSEEMFFRGGVEGICLRTSMNKGMAIWAAAFIFSLMHFQFFGFLPRLLMGAFFGYLMVWTRSLWVPVFCHALNNSMVVIVSAISENPSQKLWDEGNSLIFGNWVGVVISILMTSVFLYYFKDKFFDNHTQSQETWQSQYPQATGK